MAKYISKSKIVCRGTICEIVTDWFGKDYRPAAFHPSKWRENIHTGYFVYFYPEYMGQVEGYKV